PDAGEKKTKASRFGQDPDVGRRREDGAGPCCNSVHRGNHGLGYLAQVAYACPCHPGKLEHPARVHLEQLGDDPVDVAARTETAAPSADDEHANVATAPAQRIGEVADVRVYVEGQRVEALRPREGDRRDAVAFVVVEVLPSFHVGHTATASISTSASGWNSELTSTSVVAG